MSYNWQLKDWPNFTYEDGDLEDIFFAFAEKTGLVSGMFMALTDAKQKDMLVDIMITEAIKTSEIEGEFLSRIDVMSSIRNNLDFTPEVKNIADKRAVGMGNMLTAVRKDFQLDLSNETLFSWHSMVMEGTNKTKRGAYRTHSEPMQIISGPFGKEKIHFEAPPSHRVQEEMDHFIKWFNASRPGGKKEIKNGLVRSAIAHLYFESIHPFEDGNGRIGRAIAEKALSQNLNRPVLLSLSASIEESRNKYYDALEKSQKSNEISLWIRYFTKMAFDAQIKTEQLVEFTLKKTKFFDKFLARINDRQFIVINRILMDGISGFKGGLNTRKYVVIAKTSKATASRDLQELVEIGAIQPIGDGRSRSYNLIL